jgi:hypothetical protein
MAFFTTTDFKVGNRYAVVVRPTVQSQILNFEPNEPKRLEGECIAVHPFNILLRPEFSSLHYAISYENMADMEALPDLDDEEPDDSLFPEQESVYRDITI